jgi:hypothetical protein
MHRAIDLCLAAYLLYDVCRGAGDDSVDLITERSEILGVEFQLCSAGKTGE